MFATFHFQLSFSQLQSLGTIVGGIRLLYTSVADKGGHTMAVQEDQRCGASMDPVCATPWLWGLLISSTTGPRMTPGCLPTKMQQPPSTSRQSVIYSVSAQPHCTTTHFNLSTGPGHTKKDHNAQSGDEKVKTKIQKGDRNLPKKALPLTDEQIAVAVRAAQTKHVTYAF